VIVVWCSDDELPDALVLWATDGLCILILQSLLHIPRSWLLLPWDVTGMIGNLAAREDDQWLVEH